MPINTFNAVRPNQALGAGDVLALAIEEYGGAVEHTLRRQSALSNFIKFRPVKGTSTLTNYAMGATTLAKVTAGQTPDGNTVPNVNKASLVIDELVYARNFEPLLDSFQTQYDARTEMGIEHGTTLAKFRDQVLFIQAMKSALAVSSKYGALAGYSGVPKKPWVLLVIVPTPLSCTLLLLACLLRCV